MITIAPAAEGGVVEGGTVLFNVTMQPAQPEAVTVVWGVSEESDDTADEDDDFTAGITSARRTGW